jgi:hypothetical protein
LYLSLVLIPVGVLCLVAAATLLASSNGLAITFAVLGAGLTLFGAFGPRMEGAFKLTATGVQGQLAPPVEQRLREAVRSRIKETGSPAAAQPGVEKAVLESARVLLGSTGQISQYNLHVLGGSATTEDDQPDAIWRLGEDLTDIALGRPGTKGSKST